MQTKDMDVEQDAPRSDKLLRWPLKKYVTWKYTKYSNCTKHKVEMLSFAAPVMMSLISYALLGVWYHVMLMSIFLHSLERLCQ